MRLTHSEDYYIRVLLRKIKIREVMTTPVISVLAGESLYQVVTLMQKNRIRHMPITNEQGQLIGLLTERDIYRIQPPRKLEDGSWFYEPEDLNRYKLNHVMVHDPFRLRPDDTLAEAVATMAKKKYGCVPVVDEKDGLCGILTQFDFLKMAAEILAE